MIAGEHALRELGLGIGVRDADAIAALLDDERAEGEVIVQRRVRSRIHHGHAVEELELAAGADAVARTELDVDVLAVDLEHDGIGVRDVREGR